MKIIKARKEAVSVLKEVGITTIPVALDRITDFYDIKVSYDLDDTISGVMISQGDKTFIGINPNESTVRQRFTIAHEIGHYRLHRKIAPTFIDKDYIVMKRSGEKSELELEANAFAAELLMPEIFLNIQINLLTANFSVDEKIKILAKKFEVSTIAMTYRLANLGML